MPRPQELLEVDISVKELVPVTITAVMWDPQGSTDNMAVVASLQQISAKSLPLMHLIHCISLFRAFYGFIVVLSIYLEYQ